MNRKLPVGVRNNQTRQHCSFTVCLNDDWKYFCINFIFIKLENNKKNNRKYCNKSEKSDFEVF